MPKLVLIPNPLRFLERETHDFKAGARVCDVVPEDYISGTVMLNGEKARPLDIVHEGDIVLAIRRPQVDPASIVVNIIISLAISAAFSLLFPPPKLRDPRGDESSPTYSFGGITNNRGEGQPIPIGHGTMASGGQIISEFIDVAGIPPRTTLYQLISFGHGPFSSIGGVTEDTPSAAPLVGGAIPSKIKINGSAAANFDGVRAWVRLGTSEQEPVPGFDEIRQTFPVDVQLDSTEVAGNETLQLLSGFSIAGEDEYDATNNAFWSAAVAYDFDSEDVDGFVWVLSMPQGYFAQDPTTGATQGVGLSYQVRYIELDGLGAPITTGGYASDGYVRLPVEGPVVFAERSPLRFQVRGDFFDPQTYSPAEVGKALSSDGNSGARVDYAAASGIGYAAGFEIPSLSSMGWIRTGNATGSQWLWGDLNDATDRGHGVFIVEQTFTVNGATTTARVLGAAIGRGSATLVVFAGTRLGSFGVVNRPPADLSSGLFDSAAIGKWTHVAMRYVQNEGIALFINGIRIPTTSTAILAGGVYDLEWEGGTFHVAGNPDTSVAGAFNGEIDDVKVYDANLFDGQIRADWASGQGTTRPIPGFEDDLVFRASFETAGGGGQQSAANWYGSGAIQGTGLTTGNINGIVREGLAGTPKRSRYRVELLRVSRSSSSANIADDIEVESIQSITRLGLSYPGLALLGLHIPATEQLNDAIPTTTAVNDQRLSPIWDGESRLLPSFRFAFSRNPAWNALGMILDRQLGLGNYYNARTVDLPSFLAWANYCDEYVYDGRPRITVSNAVSPVPIQYDVLYSSATTDPSTGEARGSLEFRLPLDKHPQLPSSWKAGNAIRPLGWPDDSVSGVDLDINFDDGAGGYEIISITKVANSWRILCYWDRLDEGDPWVDGSELVADILADQQDANGAKLEGGHRRFEINGVFDRPNDAWGALLEICAVGRAAPVRIGSTIKVRFSRPRTPVGVITSSNVIPDTFEVDFASPKSRPNALTLSILDQDQAFEAVPVQAQADELQLSGNQSFVRQENRQLFGVTDAAQAERHGRHILKTHQLIRRSGRFKAGFDSLPYEVGDLLRVSSAVLPRGQGGRVAGNSESTDIGLVSARSDFTDAAWTKSGVTVTANAAADPLSGAMTADTLTAASGISFVSQSILPSDPVEGWYTVSAILKQGTAGDPSIEVVTDRGVAKVTFGLFDLLATVSSSLDVPARAGIRNIGGDWRFVWLSFFAKSGIGPGGILEVLTLKLYPGVKLGGKIEACRVVATASDFPATDAPGRMLILDQDVEITGDETNTVHVQDSRSRLVSAAVSATLSPAGTVPAGSPIWTAADMTISPARGNPAIVSRASDELVVEITGVSRASDLTATFEFVEYDAGVFDDEAQETAAGTGEAVLEAELPSLGTQPRPAPPAIVGVEEIASDSPSTEFRIGLQHESGIASAVTGVAVFYRIRSAGTPRPLSGGWALGAAANGPAAEISVVVPGPVGGDLLDFSVSAISRAYPTPDAESGRMVTHEVDGLARAGTGLSALAAEWSGLEGVIVATPSTALSAQERVEVRRGGWHLGQLVALSEPGSTRIVTGDVFAPFASTVPGTLYARVRTAAGGYGSLASVVPTVDISSAIESFVPDVLVASEEWETFSAAGVWGATAPADSSGPFNSGFELNLADELVFASGFTSATYTTTFDAVSAVSLGQSQPLRDLLVMAAVEAIQVPPEGLSDLAIDPLSEEARRWTEEGALWSSWREPGNCSLAIEFRLHSGAGWESWRAFRPGVYRAVDVQFRLVATRPNESFNIRVVRFHTRIELPRRRIVDHSTRDISALSEVI